jgi:hypothetical protein
MSAQHNVNPKIVYLLISGSLSSLHLKLMLILEDYKINMITDLANINDSDIVIPCTVMAQSMLYKSDIYMTLDDKTSFYNYITDNCQELLQDIHLIPTYNSGYNGSDKYSTFLIKPNDGHGSQNQKMETGYISDIITKYGKNNQIQDIINISIIYELDFICRDGHIIGSIFHETEASSRTPQDYVFGIFCTQIIDLPDGMLEMCENIIKKTNYNGFIEFEFIKDRCGVIYIMECNPRLSGFVCNPMYFERLIGPYYNIKSSFCENLIKSNNYNCNSKMRLFDNRHEICRYVKYKIDRFLDSLNFL